MISSGHADRLQLFTREKPGELNATHSISGLGMCRSSAEPVRHMASRATSSAGRLAQQLTQLLQEVRDEVEHVHADGMDFVLGTYRVCCPVYRIHTSPGWPRLAFRCSGIFVRRQSHSVRDGPPSF